MKTLIAIAALAAANIASAAPQTIYFAGNIYNGSVVDPNTGTWVQTSVGGAFSGSITFDGAKGTLPNRPPIQGPDHNTRTREDNGSPEGPIVSGFTFTYAGISYSKLSLTSVTDYEWSFVSKSTSNYEFDDQWVYTPQAGGYSVGASAAATHSSPVYYSSADRSLSLLLTGGAGLVSDALDLAGAPNLDFFDPATSEVYFSDSNFTCAYVLVDTCVGTALFGQGGINVFGRLTYLSGTPFPISELPEPGSIALVALGIMGLVAVPRRRAKTSSAS